MTCQKDISEQEREREREQGQGGEHTHLDAGGGRQEQRWREGNADGEGWQQPKGRRHRGSRECSSVTLFVANLPDFTTNNWLQRLFNRWGALLDTFIPRKKDVAGRTFSFVRMDNGGQAEMAVRELNGSLLEGQKLQVNPAHFSRGDHPRRSQTQRRAVPGIIPVAVSQQKHFTLGRGGLRRGFGERCCSSREPAVG